MNFKASGVRIGFFLMNTANLGVGLALSFGYSWTITLLILGFLPFIIAAGFIQTKLLTGFSKSDKKALDEAGKITNETISNIRTVANLNKEKYFFTKFSDLIEKPHK